METKACTKCKVEKFITDFYKQKGYKNRKNHTSFCKECIKEQVRKRASLPEIKERDRKRQKDYREKNKEYIKKWQKDYRERNKERLKKYRKEYVSRPEIEKHLKEYRKEYYSRPDIKERVKEYSSSKEVKERGNRLRRIRYRKDVRVKINSRMCKAIYRSLKNGNGKNGRHWETLVGYTAQDLKRHLNKTMPEGYNWNDYLQGRLQIDHINPLSAHQFKSYKDRGFHDAWKLNNLRLLPKKENQQKNAKLIRPVQLALIVKE